MKGRKPIYRPEELKVGDRLELKGDARSFAHQYCYQFRQKLPGRIFSREIDKSKVYIKRIA